MAAPKSVAAGAWWALALLTFTYLFSFVDRFAVSVLVEPIKADLGFSDIQIGLLQGAAFSIFYAIAGLPLGRLADTVNRKALIAAGVLIWSVATAVSGLASTFAFMFLARIVVGVGEAALSPAAISMFADMFPPDKLGKAIGLYTAGAVAGSGVALTMGGAILSYFDAFDRLSFAGIGAVEPWQATFFSVGLPGVLLAALILFTLREPARGGGDKQAVALSAAITRLNENRFAFGGLFALYAIASSIAYAVAGWSSAYLSRAFALDPGQAGMLFGGVMLTCGLVGPIASGATMDLMQRSGQGDRTMLAAAAAYGIIVLGSLIGFTTQDLTLTLLGMALVAFGFTASFSFPLVELQRLAPGPMRGLATAMNLTLSAIVGISLGPVLVPLASKYVFGGALGGALALVVATVALLGIACSLLLFGPLARAHRQLDPRGGA